jgi:hypothetical protein
MQSPTAPTWLRNGADPCNTMTPSVDCRRDGAQLRVVDCGGGLLHRDKKVFSERRKTVSRSLRVTMPINRPPRRPAPNDVPPVQHRAAWPGNQR